MPRFGTATDWPLGLEAYLDKHDVVASRGSFDLSSNTNVHILLLRNEDEGPKSPLVLVVEQARSAPDHLSQTAHSLMFDWYVTYDPDYLWTLVDEIEGVPLRKEYLQEAFTWFVWTLDPTNEKTLPLLNTVKDLL